MLDHQEIGKKNSSEDSARIYECSIMRFTKTWLQVEIPDSCVSFCQTFWPYKQAEI